MKRLVLVLVIAVLLGGCFAPIVPPSPTARFTITSWEQDYYEYFDEYAYVYVYFNITNTGSVDIDYYEVWIEIECADGSVYQDWTNGLNVAVGKTLSDWTLINTAGKRAVVVRITDYELTSYGY